MAIIIGSYEKYFLGKIQGLTQTLANFGHYR